MFRLRVDGPSYGPGDTSGLWPLASPLLPQVVIHHYVTYVRDYKSVQLLWVTYLRIDLNGILSLLYLYILHMLLPSAFSVRSHDSLTEQMAVRLYSTVNWWTLSVSNNVFLGARSYSTTWPGKDVRGTFYWSYSGSSVSKLFVHYAVKSWALPVTFRRNISHGTVSLV